ncbi:MAG: hypothetical protein ABR971_07150 [Acidobacteriaceae bacterium]|jgi:hypothetical protein
MISASAMFATVAPLLPREAYPPQEAAIASTVSIATVIAKTYAEAIGIPIIPVEISIGVVGMRVTVCDSGHCGIVAGGWRSVTGAGRLSGLIIVAIARTLIWVALIVISRILASVR